MIFTVLKRISNTLHNNTYIVISCNTFSTYNFYLYVLLKITLNNCVANFNFYLHFLLEWDIMILLYIHK